MTEDATSTAVDSHVGKWLTHEPEMEIALVFAGAGRQRARLWGALLNEWLDAVFDVSDPGVAQAKLAWWSESLTVAGSAHPLVHRFAQETGDTVPATLWLAVTDAALALAAVDTSPADVAALVSSRLPLATALMAVETALWPQAGAGDALALARSLVLRQWRRHRSDALPQPGWLPLQLLARHGLRAQAVYAGEDEVASRALFADLAAALLALPALPAGPRLRRIRTRLDGRALARLSRNHAKPFTGAGLALLWQCWRGARGVPA